MSFALFNSGAAQAYANSFQPWKANGGFDKVQSTVATDIFTKIPFMNFQAEVEMAKAGLMGYTGAKKQQMVNDTSKELLGMKLDYYKENREDVQKENRKAALMRMMGSSGGGSSSANSVINSVLSGGGVYDNSQLISAMHSGSVSGDAAAITRTEQGLRGAANADNAPIAGAVRTGIEGLPSAPPSPGGGTPVPQQPVVRQVELQTPPAPSVGSGKEFDVEASLQAALKKIRAERSPSESTTGNQQ